MSTEVFVRVTKPNHNRAKVTVQGLRADGLWGDVPTHIIEQGEEMRFLLYGSQRLLVEEIE